MKQAGRLLARAIREMRDDCFENTRLEEDSIRNILPIEGMRD